MIKYKLPSGAASVIIHDTSPLAEKDFVLPLTRRKLEHALREALEELAQVHGKWKAS